MNHRQTFEAKPYRWAEWASTDTFSDAEENKSLAREVGITTGSFMRHLTVEPQPGKLCLLDLPRIMRDELGMRVIDVMTAVREQKLTAIDTERTVQEAKAAVERLARRLR